MRLKDYFFIILLIFFVSSQATASEINVYSARKEALIKPLLDKFSDETNIKINLVTGKADALLKRLETEGQNSPADLFITVDAGRLYRATEKGVLRKISSKTLNRYIEAKYRDPDGYWYGLSLRSRVIVLSKRIKENERFSNMLVDGRPAMSYMQMARPEWKGQICIRSSSNIYNQSLVASMIARLGVKPTEKWAKDLVGNFARAPHGGDRDQIKAVAAGLCNLAVVNHYYLAKMLISKDRDQAMAANQVFLIFPNQETSGAHVNISGAGITRFAPHPDNALRLLEYLVSEDAQNWYAKVNHEYPVRSGVGDLTDELANWGPFAIDDLDLSELGRLNSTALMLMDRVGWQ